MRHETRTATAAIVTGILLAPSIAASQGVEDQIGFRGRAEAAQQMIVVAVQQGISSLPPTSGQSFLFRFDPELGAFTPSEKLGPTSFRVPQTIGDGIFSFRAATSYFDLDESFGPATYAVRQLDGTLDGFTQFGLSASAQVGLISFAASYGIGERFELMTNIPVVITSVEASQSFVSAVSDLYLPLSQSFFSGAATREGLAERLDTFRCLQTSGTDQCFAFRTATMGQISGALQANGFPGIDFSEGVQAGLGRISLGGKALLYTSPIADLAAMGEFFVPSPNEAEFAGPSSPAILPRLVGAIHLSDEWNLHVDAGYDYDFDTAELRGFTWNTGGSLALNRFTVDLGFGGTKFDQGIEWTPAQADLGDFDGNKIGSLQVVSDNTLGDNYVNFLGGVKVRLADRLVLSGAVSVPINDEGFRPDAIGTLALEYYTSP